jgi:DNA-binding response OmpR family regulator
MPELVLLVDDDPRLVGALQIRLEACGYLVQPAYDGEEGLSAARRLRPRIIVLDVNMPKMDGLEVCRLVRAEQGPSATGIIVISAVSHDTVRRAAIEAGANEFLGKPYQPAQMIAAIRACLAKAA